MADPAAVSIPVLNQAPLTPDACDPTTGICYAGNDPNTPVGPGGVTTHVAIVDSGAGDMGRYSSRDLAESGAMLRGTSSDPKSDLRRLIGR